MKIEETAVYTTSEVAELLKVSLPTIKRMLKDGRLKSTRIGRQHRFLGSDILEILTEKKDLRKDADQEMSPAPAVGETHFAAQGSAKKTHAEKTPRVPAHEEERTQTPPVRDEMSTIERRQRAYMIGRKVLTPLHTENGEILFEEGTVVDEEVLIRAKQEQKLMELFACITHDE